MWIRYSHEQPDFIQQSTPDFSAHAMVAGIGGHTEGRAGIGGGIGSHLPRLLVR